VLLFAVAACGNSTTTPTPTPSPTAVHSNPAPTFASPTPTIVPVPTSAFVAPSTATYVLDDAKSKVLQSKLADIVAGGKYPGISAAVVFPDGTIWSGVSGQAVLKPAQAVTTDTLFSIGSISKTFVAAMIGRLAAAGTIGMDDPLSRYQPDFPNADNITIRELLNHTSGIQDLFSAPGIADSLLTHPTQSWTPEQVLAKIGAPYFAPGKGYHYSNTNFVLLGLVIEKVTGQTVASLVRSAFLTPLGMTNTYLQTEETAQGPIAHGYMEPPAKPVDNHAGTMLPFTAEATAVGFAGAYVSTATDLAKWANALYGGSILDKATLAAMADTSASLKYKPKTPYGLGLEQASLNGQLTWGHRGLLDGFWSAMEYLPAYHITVVSLINANWADPVTADAALFEAAIS
jgi:D-alanyl-D-alanine carboxypeptidase